MVTVILHNKIPYPPLIQILRKSVLGFTLLFALWQGYFPDALASISPTSLLLSDHVGWSLLWEPITASLTIPYPTIGLATFFDLFLINMFLAPIISFVFSFLAPRHFIQTVSILIVSGTLAFLGANHFCSNTGAVSLFGSLAFSLVIFWALLHSKGQSMLLMGIPIPRVWVVVMAGLSVIPTPLFAGDWSKLIVIIVMSSTAYLLGIARWRLRSHVESLEKIELKIDLLYRHITRITQWHILRHFRNLRRRHSK